MLTPADSGCVLKSHDQSLLPSTEVNRSFCLVLQLCRCFNNNLTGRTSSSPLTYLAGFCGFEHYAAKRLL